MDGVTWARCSQIRVGISNEERASLKLVAQGKAAALSGEMLKMLRSRGLVQYDGATWAVTSDGRAIAFWR